MKFLLDHDVPAEVGRVLAQAGHTVVHVFGARRALRNALTSFD